MTDLENHPANEPVPEAPCPLCGEPLSPTKSICPSCGADAALDSRQTARKEPPHWLFMALLVIVAAATAAGVARVRAIGPAPDPGTALRWIAFGDGARRPTLATLQRAYETSRAVMRMVLQRNELGSIADADWPVVAGFANASWRGYVPLVVEAARASDISGRLASILEVDGTDGWGRPWRASLVTLASRPRDLYPDSIAAGPPLPRNRSLAMLTLTSSGPDRRPATNDDLSFVAVFPGPEVLLGTAEALRQRELEIERARIWWRLEGTDLDLVDARILAEWYFELRPH